MARGVARCAGCGYENPSEKNVRLHTVSCDEYILLYRRSPELALDPIAAYEAYHNEEAEAERKMAKLDRYGEVKNRLQKLAQARQERDLSRWRKVVNHSAVHVACPDDGVLVSRGRTPAQRELAAALTREPVG